MYVFNYNKTSREVTDDFAEKIAEQLLTKGKDDYLVVGKQFIGQIKKFESLEAIDNDIASDEEWETNRPPMPTIRTGWEKPPQWNGNSQRPCLIFQPPPNP